MGREQPKTSAVDVVMGWVYTGMALIMAGAFVLFAGQCIGWFFTGDWPDFEVRHLCVMLDTFPLKTGIWGYDKIVDFVMGLEVALLGRFWRSW